ncbi:MAG: hypothetical protein ACLPLP_27825 [Mycobacterium sp.]
MCAISSGPRPISPSQAAKTAADGLAGDLLFCDVLANPHAHLEHKVDLERVVEIRDLQFSGF